MGDFLLNIGCVSMDETHVAANDSTNNYVVFIYFFVSDLKIVYYKTINPKSPCLEQVREKYFASQLIWRQIIQNRLEIDATH